MHINRIRGQVYLPMVFLLLASLACKVEPPRLILENTPTSPPTFVMTEVVIEIITPTPMPPTPEPSATPVTPSPTPTWDPFSAPIYYPLEDCVASRLHVGDRAMVSLLGGPNGIRYSPDLAIDTIIYSAQPGELMDIVGGPWCSNGWLVWLVETANGVRGYTPEGNGETYWLLPVPR